MVMPYQGLFHTLIRYRILCSLNWNWWQCTTSSSWRAILSSFQSRSEIHRRELCSSRNLNNWRRLKKTREGLFSQAVGLISIDYLTELSRHVIWSWGPEWEWLGVNPFYSIADFLNKLDLRDMWYKYFNKFDTAYPASLFNNKEQHQ